MPFKFLADKCEKLKLKKEMAEESAFNCRTGGQVAQNFNLFSIWTRAMMKAFNTSMQGLEHFKFVSSRISFVSAESFFSLWQKSTGAGNLPCG